MPEHIGRSFEWDVERIAAMIVEMGDLAEAQVADALAALDRGDGVVADQVVDADERLDLAAEAIDRAAVALVARRQPVTVDLRLIAMSLKISNDLERIGDYAASVAKRAKRVAATGGLARAPSLLAMGERVRAMLADVLDAFAARDARLALDVWHRDAEVDGLYRALFRELIDEVVANPAATSVSVDLLFIAKNLERLGDHATNIAERVHYIVHGDRINRVRGGAVDVAATDCGARDRATRRPAAADDEVGAGAERAAPQAASASTSPRRLPSQRRKRAVPPAVAIIWSGWARRVPWRRW